MKRILPLFLFACCCALGEVYAAGKEPPVPVRTVAPEYPRDLRRSGVSGVVMVNCVIDERGNVLEPKVEKSSDPAFEAPAVDALKKWKFKPAMQDGSPVPTRVSIPIKFICET